VVVRGTCKCGCGGDPVAGDFLPGHDAKFHARTLNWLRTHRPEVYAKAAREAQASRGGDSDGTADYNELAAREAAQRGRST